MAKRFHNIVLLPEFGYINQYWYSNCYGTLSQRLHRELLLISSPTLLRQLFQLVSESLCLFQGDKKGEGGGASEMVTCANCAPNPCTHTTNNGVATEVRRSVRIPSSQCLSLHAFNHPAEIHSLSLPLTVGFNMSHKMYFIGFKQ